MARTHVSSGTEWESQVGYSRAVVADDQVHVSGTTATGDDGEVLGETPYEQAVAAIEIIEDALEEAGATLDDVVRTRMYVTDVDDWEEIGRAHGEFFGDARPATTMVEVERLIDPDLCVEIEATAVLPAAER